MDDGTIGYIVDGLESSGEDAAAVSGNDIEVLPEETEAVSPPGQKETVPDPETDIETVSGNDPSGASSPAVVTVSGNVVAFADSGISSGVDSLNWEMSVLNENMAALYEKQSENNAILLGMGSVLVMFFGFTLFKWCEQKIKRFVKGVFNRYE